MKWRQLFSSPLKYMNIVTQPSRAETELLGEEFFRQGSNYFEWNREYSCAPLDKFNLMRERNICCPGNEKQK